MGRFGGFGVTLQQVFKPPVTTPLPEGEAPKPGASTAVTS